MIYTQNHVNALRCMAVGDAVGNPFEFKNDRDFSPLDIMDQADYGDLNITDDTQMTLFGFESVCGNHVSEPCKRAYFNWYYTQTNEFIKPIYNTDKDILLSFPELYEQRDPGMTVMKSLSQLHITGSRMKNDSKGCGSIMRILPFIHDVKLVNESISVTHDHPENFTAAQTLVNAYNSIYEIPKVDDISDLGEGWVADECVNMAIWAAATAEDFDDLLVKSIHHNGDSDSVAAVACSLWGYWGNPFYYYDRVIEKESIEFIVKKMGF
jgi:ADP-ribosyl-[dinitrogen reductase] hydrolase